MNQDNNGDDGVNESDDENENEAENDEENPETLMENLKNIQKQQSLQININKSASQLLQSPKLHYTLAILFIGCYWLREPILLTDILQ